MRALIVFCAFLLVGLGAVSSAQADCGHVYNGKGGCQQAEICVSWDAIVQYGCTPLFTIERKCGTGNYITLTTEWTSQEYCEIPLSSCPGGFYYRITIHCDDCPGGDSIVIGPVNCP